MLTVDGDGEMEGVLIASGTNNRDPCLPTTGCGDERGTVVRCRALKEAEGIRHIYFVA
jgi:hypothetical protein